MQFRKWLETFDVVYSGGGTNPNGPVSVKININAHLSNKKAQSSLYDLIVDLNKDADYKDYSHSVLAFTFVWQLYPKTSVRDIGYAFQSLSTNRYDGPEKIRTLARAIDETSHKLNLAFVRGDVDWYRVTADYILPHVAASKTSKNTGDYTERIVHYEEPESGENKSWDDDGPDDDDKPTPKRPTPQTGKTPTSPYVLANSVFPQKIL
jgi:hypothetical protein